IGVTRFEAEMVAAINEIRWNAGVGPLSLNSHLSKAADAHSQHMASLGDDYMAKKFQELKGYTGDFAYAGPHGNIGDGTPGDRARAAGYHGKWGENVAMTPKDDLAYLLQRLLDSPSHRKNLLNPNF